MEGGRNLKNSLKYRQWGSANLKITLKNIRRGKNEVMETLKLA